MKTVPCCYIYVLKNMAIGGRTSNGSLSTFVRCFSSTTTHDFSRSPRSVVSLGGLKFKNIESE